MYSQTPLEVRNLFVADVVDRGIEKSKFQSWQIISSPRVCKSYGCDSSSHVTVTFKFMNTEESDVRTRQEGSCRQVAATPDPPTSHPLLSLHRRRRGTVTTVTFVMALSCRLGISARQTKYYLIIHINVLTGRLYGILVETTFANDVNLRAKACFIKAKGMGYQHLFLIRYVLITQHASNFKTKPIDLSVK